MADKILAVGDMHLKETLILPLVDHYLSSHSVDTIVLMGDYVDEWGQDYNAGRFRREMAFLLDWVNTKRQVTEVVCLLGNHDIPYLTHHFRPYSVALVDVRDDMYDYLQKLDPRLYYQHGSWLFTHAGAVGQSPLPLAEYDRLAIGTWDSQGLLDELESQVDTQHGGMLQEGSIVWADYHYLLDHQQELAYSHQIVGHTPVSHIASGSKLIDVDTFSLTPNGEPIGDGALLLIDDDEVRTVATTYRQLFNR